MGTTVVWVVLVAIVVAAAWLFWVRSNRLGGAPAVRGRPGRIDLRIGFPQIARHGYAPADVEALLDRVHALTADPDGQAEALEALHAASFGQESRGGYDPAIVDLHVDAMIVALQTGRDLPPKPGRGVEPPT